MLAFASRSLLVRAATLARSTATQRVAAVSSGSHVRSFAAATAIRRENHSLYGFTEEETMMRDAVRAFAESEVKPKVRDMDEKELMDPALIKAMFDQGLMGIEVDPKYGGSGSSFLATILCVEELSRIDPSMAVCMDVHSTLVNNTFSFWANGAQKEKYLTRLATDTLGSFCLSEEKAGSDAFALGTRAEKKGNKYIINGSKMWITNSGEAEIFLVFANVDPSKGYKGITCFIVERDMGVKIAKKEKKLGIRASSTCVLNFDDVEVPAENVLGNVGEGYKYAINILNEGRIGIAAQMLGLAQGAFDAAVPYLHQRKQFGKPIADFQGMQFQIAQAATEIESARLMTYNAARLKEAGIPFIKEAAMAKLYATQVAERVSSRAVEWLGGVGFTRDFPVEKFYRDSRIGAIYEGTSNIQLQTIAKIIAKDHA